MKDYLVRIEVGYKGNPDGPEILSDIEARISELILNEQDADTVVTAERIRTIIGQLGLPDDMDTRTPADNIQADSVPSDNFARRLYRNPNGAKLGGVCNGMATYFRVDPTLVRLIFCSPLLILVCISVIPFLNMFCGFFGVTVKMPVARRIGGKCQRLCNIVKKSGKTYFSVGRAGSHGFCNVGIDVIPMIR